MTDDGRISLTGFGGEMTLVNALFESASGFTATGATALDHFDYVSP